MRYRILLSMFLAVTLSFGLLSCSEDGSSQQAAWYDRHTIYSYSGTQGNLWVRMRKNLRMPDYTSRPQVQQEIRWYQHHQAYLNHVIADSAPYIYFIYQQTQAKGLPAELALIPVIESDYNPYARSNVGAMGLWQMMPGTAQGFGLKRDHWYNGCRDIVASTHAALEYFAYLHGFFSGNWLLAIAAYDAGEGTVMNTMRYNRYHGRPTDFWHLPLPYETQAYVPRLLAVAAIVKSPARYGIHLAPINDAPYIESVNVGSPIDLSKAAKLAEVPLTTMKVLNPGLEHGSTDPQGPYTLVVPKDKAQTFKQKLAAVTHNEKLLWQEHVVASKETLQKIAERYKTTVAQLREVNGLPNDKVQPDQTLLIPPSPSTDQTQATTQVAANDNAEDNDSSANTSQDNTSQDDNASQNNDDNNDNDSPASPDDTTSSSNKMIYYRVKSGDTLYRIAKRNHVSVPTLLALNHISKHHRLSLGEKLIISTSTENSATSTDTHMNASSSNSSTQTTAQQNSTKQTMTVSYEVLNGDDLNKIATKFHTSVKALRHANHLTSNDIRVGQVLTIPNKTS